MTRDGALLEITDLRVRFARGPRAVDAVRGVDLAIAEGQCVALVGESGSGKTVTALSIMRLLPRRTAQVLGGRILFRPDAKTAALDLLTLQERRMRRVRGAGIAIIFQEPTASLNPVLSVGEQIAEVLRFHQGLRGRAANERAAALLAEVGIADPPRSARAYPHQFSGGMQQRVMIAMALAGRPALLIADEPTSSLDVTVQAQILALLGRVRRAFHTTLLLITHDLGVVAELADEVHVMDAGRIVESAPVARLFTAPAHPATRRLLAATPLRPSPAIKDHTAPAGEGAHG